MSQSPRASASQSSLIDDRSDPDFPTLYRSLTRRAALLDVAATRIRLSGLRLNPSELRGPDGIRVLLMELNALQIRTEVDFLAPDPEASRRIEGVRELLDSKRLEVRCMPLGGWAPDFSIFHLGRGESTALVGPHWMERPYPQRGPALASIHTGDAVERLTRRFEELWKGAYGVESALQRLFTRPGPRRRG